MRLPRALLAGTSLLLGHPALLQAQAAADTAKDTGVSAVWLLANFSYAGMRAQNNPSKGWRIVAFIVGFPGTLLSYFVVDEGGERAYGVDLTRHPLNRGP